MHNRTRVSALLVLSLIAGCALPAKAPLPRPSLGGWSPATAALTAEPTVLTPEERALGHFLKGQIALNQNDYDEALKLCEDQGLRVKRN